VRALPWPSRHSNSEIGGDQARSRRELGGRRKGQQSQPVQPLGGTGDVHALKSTIETATQHIEGNTSWLGPLVPQTQGAASYVPST